MSGETLPPVIAVIEGDDSSLLEMFARDIAGVRDFAAQFQAVLDESLGGISLEAPTVSGEGIVAAGLEMGGLIAEGAQEGFITSLDLGADITAALKGGDVQEGAAAAGTLAAEAFDEGAAGIGSGIAEHVTAELQATLPGAMSQIGQSAMDELGAGAAAAAQSSQIGGLVGRLLGAGAGLDAAIEAGGIVGSGFARAVGDGAAADIKDALAGFGAALSAAASDIVAEAGGTVGGEFATEVAGGINPAVVGLTRVTEAAETATAAVGRLDEALSSSTGAPAAGAAGAGTVASRAAIVPQMRQQGAEAGQAWVAGVRASIEADPFVQNPFSTNSGAWIRASRLAGLQAAAAATEGLGLGVVAQIPEAEAAAHELTGAFMDALSLAGVAEPVVRAFQDLAEGLVADVAAIPEELRPGFYQVEQIFDLNGGQAARAYLMGLLEELRAGQAEVAEAGAQLAVEMGAPQAVGASLPPWGGQLQSEDAARYMAQVRAQALTSGTEAAAAFNTAFFAGLSTEDGSALERMPTGTQLALQAGTQGAAAAEGFGEGFGAEIEAQAPGMASRVVTTMGLVGGTVGMMVAEIGRSAAAEWAEIGEGYGQWADEIRAQMGLLDLTVQEQTAVTTTMLGQLWLGGVQRVTGIVQGGAGRITGAYEAVSAAATNLAITVGSTVESVAGTVNNVLGSVLSGTSAVIAGTANLVVEGLGAIVTGAGEVISGLPLASLVQEAWELSGAVEASAQEGHEAGEAFAAAYTESVDTMRLRPPAEVSGPGWDATAVVNPEAQTAEVATATDKVATSAEKATGALGGMGEMMMGPWGMAIFMGLSIVPEFAGSLGHLFDSTQAVTLSQSGLASAISTAGGTAGDSVASYVASQAQISGLATSAQAAGVSLATYTEAVLGNQDAQNQVTSSVDALNQVQLDQQLTTQSNADTTGKWSGELQGAQVQADATSVSTDKLTDQNQQLLASMRAQAQQIASTIGQQQQLAQATLTLDQNTAIFNATLSGLYSQQQLTAFTTAESSVAALNLGTNNSALNISLTASEQAYTLAQQGATAYGTALSTANGDVTTLLGSQASFTIALSGMATSVSTYGTSLDVSNDKGAQNVQTALNIASAADKAATAVYQNDLATGNANQAYQNANTYLTQEKNAFITAADKADLNKTAVQQLANEIFQLPSSVQPVNIPTNAQQVLTQIQEIQRELGQLGSGAIGGSSTDFGDLGGKQVSYYAGGGAFSAGQIAVVGEKGPELIEFGGSGFITPADMIRPAAIGPAGPAYGGAGTGGYSVGSGVTQGGDTYITINNNIAGSLLAENELGLMTQQSMTTIGSRNSTSYTTFQSGRGRSS